MRTACCLVSALSGLLLPVALAHGDSKRSNTRTITITYRYWTTS